MTTPEQEKHWQTEPPSGWRTSYRRRALADWLCDVDQGAGRLLARVIVNRYDRQVGLSEDVIATALNADVYHLLPSDYESVQKAVMEGKSIPASS